MSAARIRDIGAFVDFDTGFDPQSSGAATINGSAVDLQNTSYRNAATIAASVMVGAVGGTPTSFTATLTLQDSADGSSDWTTIQDIEGSTAGVVGSTASTAGAKGRWDGQRLRRYVRFVVTLAFVGGTSPTALVAVSGLIGTSEL